MRQSDSHDECHLKFTHAAPSSEALSVERGGPGGHLAWARSASLQGCREHPKDAAFPAEFTPLGTSVSAHQAHLSEAQISKLMPLRLALFLLECFYV